MIKFKKYHLEWVSTEKANIGIKDIPGNFIIWSLEMQSLLIGIKDLAESKILLQQTLINKTESFTSEPETPDSPRKCSRKDTSKSYVSIKALSASKPWSKNIKKRKPSNILKWMPRPWTSTKASSTPFSIKLPSTPSWYLSF